MARQTAPEYGSRTGTIARVIVDRGFCFIKDDQSCQDYFCHFSALQGGLQLKNLVPGQAVSFTPVESPKGLRAGDVYAR